MQVSPQQFQIHPSSGVPIYRQLMEQVKSLVASGAAAPGDMLPSVRELSSTLEINMMTVSRAYSKLQDQDVVEHVRGRGMRVRGQNPARSLNDRKQEVEELADPVILRAIQLGLTDDQIISLFRRLIREQRR